VAFIDPSPAPTNPGWPLRNLLAYIRALHPEALNSGLRVLCWRDAEPPVVGRDDEWKSIIGVLSLPQNTQASTNGRPTAVGWEKNAQGKLGPRMADLAPMMDPTR
jgi:ubiquitin-like modifier-activating enzyme ATG7